MANIYVDANNVSNAVSPYSSWATATNLLGTALTYARSVTGPHTIHIMRGIYTDSFIYLNNVNLDSLLILGYQDEDVLANFCDVVVSSSTNHCLQHSLSAGVTVKNITIYQGSATKAGVYAASADKILNIDCCWFIGADSATSALIRNEGIHINFKNTRIFSHRSLPVDFRNNASAVFENCISIAKDNVKNTKSWLLGSTGQIDIRNSFIADSEKHGIVVNAGTVNITNSIVHSGVSDDIAFPIYRSAGTVTVKNTLAIKTWFGGAGSDGICGEYIDGGGNLFTSANPIFNIWAHNGYILPRLDDSVNFEWGRTVFKTALSNYGFTGTHFLTEHDFYAFGSDTLLREEIVSGILEYANHSSTHSDLALAGRIATLSKNGETITVSRNTDTITVSGVDGGVIVGFMAKQLGTIQAELETLGVIVTPEAGVTISDVSCDNNVSIKVLGEALADAVGEWVLLIDVTGETGYYKNEIFDSKARWNTRAGGVVDPRTGLQYVCNGFVHPYTQESADSRQAIINAGYVYSGGVDPADSTLASFKSLKMFDMFAIKGIGPNYIVGETEAKTRENARLWAFAALHTGLIISLMTHADFTADELDWIFDEWSTYPQLKVCSHAEFQSDISNSELWAENPVGIFTKTSAINHDFSLHPTSPLIGAGIDVGLTTDADGNAVPGALGFDIGPYSYMSGWSPFDSTMPALTLSPTAPGDLRSVQCWSKVASAKEIEKY